MSRAAGWATGKRDAFGSATLPLVLSKLVLKVELSDPMSGFFMMRTDRFHEIVRRLSGIGFKILLDIFASASRPLKFKELGYEFRPRHHGASKLDNRAVWDFIMLLADKSIGRFVPVRFFSFAIIGGLGAVIHIAILALLFRWLETEFLVAQTVATLTAMTSNFVLNNELTYRDQRLRGWGFVRGLLTFVLACSVGAFANVGIAEYLFYQEVYWLGSGVAGILVGAVWNYVVTSVYTWKAPKNR